jgi:AcrR family transcriptional regulator
MATKSIMPGPRDERGVSAARILTAARDTFAMHGWAGTTIREIARAADVDPALVYHYYGSKENLLDAATNPPPKMIEAVARTWQAPKPELGCQLVELFLANWADAEIGPVLRAIMQTAAHEPVTHAKLRAVVERSLMGVSTLGEDEKDKMRRSGLIASQLMGLALVRYIWRIEPIASMSEHDVVAAVAPNLQRYIDAELSAPTARRQ